MHRPLVAEPRGRRLVLSLRRLPQTIDEQRRAGNAWRRWQREYFIHQAAECDGLIDLGGMCRPLSHSRRSVLTPRLIVSPPIWSTPWRTDFPENEHFRES